MQPPGYFNNIQRRAAERWDQLEHDPELAGPWHQLFRQVQSPRHVVSELLQNADDAGARSASVRIEDNTFIFEHDGGDFDGEQFASLCRFGFSNKRNLHTIGFRGVGFKSTFSLGDTVEVRTQTLAVCFKKKRFTQPVWLNDGRPAQRTVIRVRITDPNRVAQLRKNFEEWAQSPASLLFFNSLKELTIEGQTIERQPVGKGPVADSSWEKLVGGTDVEKLLVLQSEAIPFPTEAAEEIRAERGVGAEDLHLPPCRVEIVLGLGKENRLYVVLPTGAGLDLPFSCNAPFIQDPARFAIKDPATSPTNRRLLERAGRLAAKAMLKWLDNNELSAKDRAAAYDLLKGAVQFAPGLDGTCSQIIMGNMLAELKGQRVVLTTDRMLADAGECVAVPEELFSVWESDQLLNLFAPASNHLLASEASGCINKLRSHGWINTVDSDGALKRLEQSEQTLSKMRKEEMKFGQVADLRDVLLEEKRRLEHLLQRAEEVLREFQADQTGSGPAKSAKEIAAPRPSPLDQIKSVVAATKDLRLANGNLSAERIARLYGISLSELAKWLGRTKQAVSKTPDADSLQNALSNFERVARLRLMMENDAEFRKWLRMPHPEISGQNPLQLMAKGEWQAVADFVDDVLAGTPG